MDVVVQRTLHVGKGVPELSQFIFGANLGQRCRQVAFRHAGRSLGKELQRVGGTSDAPYAEEQQRQQSQQEHRHHHQSQPVQRSKHIPVGTDHCHRPFRALHRFVEDIRERIIVLQLVHAFLAPYHRIAQDRHTAVRHVGCSGIDGLVQDAFRLGMHQVVA